MMQLQMEKQKVDEANGKLADDVFFIGEVEKSRPVPVGTSGTIAIATADGHKKAQMLAVDNKENEEIDLIPSVDAFLPHIEKLACPELDCLGQFESRSKLNSHLLHVHGISPHQCMLSTCNKTFNRKCYLTHHVGIEHANVKEWNCPKCAAQYSQYYQCMQHMIKCHELNQFKCPRSDCTFKSIYRTEMLKHTTQNAHYLKKSHSRSMDCGPVTKRVCKSQPNRYLCKWAKCAFGSSDRVALLHHIQNEHLIRGDKPDCVKQNAKPEKFIATVAGKFHCSEFECPFMSNSKVLLEQHKLHHSLRKHVCRVGGCGKIFKTSSTTRIHERIHLGLEHKCTWANCEYKATKASSVIVHIRVNHLQLPRTIKTQEKLNIKSDFDPKDFVKEVSKKM